MLPEHIIPHKRTFAGGIEKIQIPAKSRGILIK
jgi:hypothetical protein